MGGPDEMWEMKPNASTYQRYILCADCPTIARQLCFAIWLTSFGHSRECKIYQAGIDARSRACWAMATGLRISLAEIVA